MKFTESIVVSVLACSLNLQIHLRVAVSGVARGGSKDVNLVTRLDDKRLTNLWFTVEILFEPLFFRRLHKPVITLNFPFVLILYYL